MPSQTPGIVYWFQNLFRKPPAPAAAPPAEPPPGFDKRWTAYGSARYLQEGRLCVRRHGDWQAEYLYDVFAAGRRQQVRVVMPETDVARWEREHDKRMPEAARQRLVKQTLEALIDLGRVPTAITVSASEIQGSGG
ncbi:MAG: hypothetical protein HYX27_19010 [Acidobacteria bacterium]|nr:hypothetical protein [Acidobacteriota bacterium]